MKRFIVALFCLVAMFFIAPVYGQDKYVGIAYIDVGASDVKGGAMGFSGTSVCSVIDLYQIKDIDGYLSFQFKTLTGTTNTTTWVSGDTIYTAAPPVSGTTVSVHVRLSNIDTAAAWAAATKNTIVNGVNAYSGATNVGYYLNSIMPSGVTPFRFLRPEFESGVSADTGGNGNIKPLGVLFVR